MYKLSSIWGELLLYKGGKRMRKVTVPVDMTSEQKTLLGVLS
ncbi:PrgI family protein, partial [Bacillus cereus]